VPLQAYNGTALPLPLPLYYSTVGAKCTRILRTSDTCFHVACILQNYSRWTLVAQQKANRWSAAYQTQRTGVWKSHV